MAELAQNPNDSACVAAKTISHPTMSRNCILRRWGHTATACPLTEALRSQLLRALPCETSTLSSDSGANFLFPLHSSITVCFGGFGAELKKTTEKTIETNSSKQGARTWKNTDGRLNSVVVWHPDLGGSEDSWIEIETTGNAPCPRLHHAAVFAVLPSSVLCEILSYIPASVALNVPCLVVFGGRCGPKHSLNDLFALNLESLSWHEISAVNAPPPPRWRHAYCGVIFEDCVASWSSFNDSLDDSFNERVVMYVHGGRTEHDVLSDLWVLKLKLNHHHHNNDNDDNNDDNHNTHSVLYLLIFI